MSPLVMLLVNVGLCLAVVGFGAAIVSTVACFRQRAQPDGRQLA
jgi:hypothetical protein